MLQTLFKATRELQQGVRTVSDATGTASTGSSLSFTPLLSTTGESNGDDFGVSVVGPVGPSGPVGMRGLDGSDGQDGQDGFVYPTPVLPFPVIGGRTAGAVAAVTSVVTTTVSTLDCSYVVWANVLVTTATNHNFTVTVAYTDESNTPQTLTLSFTLAAGGAFTTAVVNANGTVPYMGIPQAIRCKAGSTITIATVGVFTTVVYNVEGFLQQIQQG